MGLLDEYQLSEAGRSCFLVSSRFPQHRPHHPHRPLRFHLQSHCLHHVYLGFLYALIAGHSLLRLLATHCIVLRITLLVAHAEVCSLLLALIEHHRACGRGLT